MQLTLQDVMNIEAMDVAKRLTTDDTFNLRPVESISVIELPVENFVRKNEFVLTTAIGCNQDINIFKKFIQDICESEATALAIATGRHVLEIPKEIIMFAAELQFPLIEVPWEVRFSEITQSVFLKLNDLKRSALERSEELQKRMLQLFLDGATLSDACEVIQDQVRLPAIITDQHGTIKGKSSNAQFLVEQCQNALQKKMKHELDHTFQLELEYNGESWIHELGDAAIKLVIQASHKKYGYLILASAESTPVDSLSTSGEKFLLEHTATAVALWFQRETAIQETELRLKDDFVWSLAKGEIESWDTMLSRAKSLNYDIARPYVCILGLPENLESVYKKNDQAEATFDQWLHQNVRYLEGQMEQAGKSIKCLTMLTYHHDRFVIFLEAAKDHVKETVKLFLDHVESRLKDTLPDLVLSWGIGENHAGIKTFNESFNDARIALEIGSRQKGAGHRSTYANTGIYRALLSLASTPEMQELTLSTIGTLVDYDDRRGLELVNTLIAYIRTQGNVSQTSRVLNLHRQSLLYRLKKIESLTGRTLEDPDDLFVLDLSVKLWMTGMMLNDKSSRRGD